MCGIFGLVTKRDALSAPELSQTLDRLFRLSESRGKESAGVAILARDTISVYKQPLSASALLQSPDYHFLVQDTLFNRAVDPNIALIGHARLVTNGSQENHDNNQPVIKDGIVGIHNGIIVNDAELWQAFEGLERHYQVDTEVVLSLIRHFYAQTGDLLQAMRLAFQPLKGTISLAALFDDLNVLAIATNNGSLYTCAARQGGSILFASEMYILRQLLKHNHTHNLFSEADIQQVKPGFGYIIDVATVEQEKFALEGEQQLRQVAVSNHTQRAIVDVTPEHKREATTSTDTGPTVVPTSIFRRFSIDTAPIKALRRCSRCVLPETMPFITFDEQGVCNYCRNHEQNATWRYRALGEKALAEFVEPYRSQHGEPDCIVTFSGGRDSSYALHYVKTVLGMNPIAYSYDWGMITDLARRNQARLCGQLGIEHILVSADINRKRAYIRQNVTAWLKRPHLGTIPLFMAGDKQYFYYANQLRQQTGVKLIVLAVNLLETTFFKFGYCGVPPQIGRLTVHDQLRMALFYSKEYLLNMAYINGSLLDTVGAFASYYFIPHNYLNLYEYIRWDEDIIDSTLAREYDWELATDTQTTWRIGDGTASFYNYIYYILSGFTENDTLRSNQIREGMLSREKALELVYEDNQPRFESIQWYCNTIGIDMESTLERLQAIPKRYKA